MCLKGKYASFWLRIFQIRKQFNAMDLNARKISTSFLRKKSAHVVTNQKMPIVKYHCKNAAIKITFKIKKKKLHSCEALHPFIQNINFLNYFNFFSVRKWYNIRDIKLCL